MSEIRNVFVEVFICPETIRLHLKSLRETHYEATVTRFEFAPRILLISSENFGFHFSYPFPPLPPLPRREREVKATPNIPSVQLAAAPTSAGQPKYPIGAAGRCPHFCRPAQISHLRSWPPPPFPRLQQSWGRKASLRFPAEFPRKLNSSSRRSKMGSAQ